VPGLPASTRASQPFHHPSWARVDGLQRSVARTDPARQGPPTWVRKPVAPAAAFGHQQRHVFTDRSSVERTPVKSVRTHHHEQIQGSPAFLCTYASGSLANSSSMRLASSTVRTSSIRPIPKPIISAVMVSSLAVVSIRFEPWKRTTSVLLASEDSQIGIRMRFCRYGQDRTHRSSS
jgi:hypothetical protein